MSSDPHVLDAVRRRSSACILIWSFELHVGASESLAGSVSGLGVRA